MGYGEEGLRVMGKMGCGLWGSMDLGYGEEGLRVMGKKDCGLW